MILSEAIGRLRSDLDDETEYQQVFSDLQLAKFIGRACQNIQEMTGLAQKQEYYVLDGKQPVYDLPSDYVSIKRMFDSRNIRNLNTTFISDLVNFRTGEPTAYKVDPKRNKVVFDYIPDPGTYGENRLVGILPTSFWLTSDYYYIDIVGGSKTGPTYYWPAQVLKVDNGNYTEYLRVAYIEDVTTTIGLDSYTAKRFWFSERDLKATYPTVNTFNNYTQLTALGNMVFTAGSATVTFSISGAATYLQKGDLINCGDASGIVDTIDSGTQVTLTEASVYASPVVAQSGYRYDTRIRLVDYIMEYSYMPEDLWWRGINGANKLVQGYYYSATPSISLMTGAGSNKRDDYAKVGDGIFIPKLTQGLVDDGEGSLIGEISNDSISLTGTTSSNATVAVAGTGTLFSTQCHIGDEITLGGVTRKIVSIASATSMNVNATLAAAIGTATRNANAYILETAFTFSPSRGAVVYVIPYGDTLPFPQEMHSCVLEWANYYALKRMGDDEAADTQYERAKGILDRYLKEQREEEMMMYNNASYWQQEAQTDFNQNKIMRVHGGSLYDNGSWGIGGMPE